MRRQRARDRSAERVAETFGQSGLCRGNLIVIKIVILCSCNYHIVMVQGKRHDF